MIFCFKSISPLRRKVNPNWKRSNLCGTLAIFVTVTTSHTISWGYPLSLCTGPVLYNISPPPGPVSLSMAARLLDSTTQDRSHAGLAFFFLISNLSQQGWLPFECESPAKCLIHSKIDILLSIRWDRIHKERYKWFVRNHISLISIFCQWTS